MTTNNDAGSVVPLHQQNPAQRFSDRADHYASYRPSYPAQAIAAILEGLGDPTQLTIADIGAGTGIASRLLAQTGATIWAVEPNAAMRAAAKPDPHIIWHNATAEQTDLPTASVDLVTCFQAFHWFDPDLALSEFHRILKPGGRVALVWNSRDRSTALGQHYEDCIQSVGDRQITQHQNRKSAQPLHISPLFTGFRSVAVDHQHFLTLDGLIGLCCSTSYMPKAGPEFERMVAQLTQLFAHHAEQTANDTDRRVAIAYHTKIYLATRQETRV